MSSNGKGMAWTKKTRTWWQMIQDKRARRLTRLGYDGVNLSPHQMRRKVKQLQGSSR